MTREDAISMLYGMRSENLNFDDAYTKDKYVSLDIAISVLEREPVFDKIKRDIFSACCDSYNMPIYKLTCDEIFEIIDKYKVKSEVLKHE